ncbi:protein downstream neighbor of Son-like [Dendronephthya gigantea]|uniref:protein downstream neighbor of Son-like n=1 Tax=Dendronephthya gigantea TaxID=151771 RepID=UPI00106CA3C8|nr:protein downstream neighbor of Son-like [Dendronephthya gigantea]
MCESEDNNSQENWRKPARSIKLVVKKRTSKREGIKSSRILQSRNSNTEQEPQLAGQVKRQNPFGCSASKKPNIDRSSENDESFGVFDALEQGSSRTSTTSDETQTLINNKLHDVRLSEVESHNLLNRNSEDSDKDNHIKRLSGRNLPVDWSLKTRVRFTSSRSFNWCSKILRKQEANGLCGFVQCKSQNTDEDSSCFQQNIMYWMHPALPWLSLFPRLTSDTKLTSKVPNVAENQDIANALQASWCQSFRSLFNLLWCGQCDYFYLCSASFTVLFRAKMIGGLASTSAYITPTTKGIREGFDKEGISYTLPLLDASTSKNDSDDEKNPLVKDDDDDDTVWLESMGVAKETLPQLKQSKINQQRARLRNIDHHSSSLAVVNGSHTQALFNYLLNNKTVIAKTGSHAGIPPTLLAPVAFDGAALQSLFAKQNMFKQGKNLEKTYSLDITGPVLPGNLFKLCKLFETTQQRQFSAVMKNLQVTAAFNVLPNDMQDEERIDDDDHFLTQPSNLGGTNLASINCDNFLYSWETNK